MIRILFLLLVCSVSTSIHAQKRSKEKNKQEITDYDSLAPVPVTKKTSKKDTRNDKQVNTNYDSLAPAPVTKKTSKKDDKKGKQVNTNYDSLSTAPLTKKTSKKGKKDSKVTSVNYIPDVVIPVADSSKKFTGLIKYSMTTDDPASKDSIFVVFGETQIRVTRFIAGYRADQIFEKIFIANFSDSTFIELDTIKRTYKTQKLGGNNTGFEFSLMPDKKTGKVMNFTCEEYIGEMTMKEDDVFEAACLLSNQHYYIQAMDYNFMNIQPLVIGYKIVLGFRNRSSDNENTYIIAYKIEPGNTDKYFDLTGYKAL
jgi:hypothetical protein